MKDLHDVVSHNIKEVILYVSSGENDADLSNTNTMDILSKALEHVVMEAGLSQKSYVKGTKNKYGNSEGQPIRVLPMRVAKGERFGQFGEGKRHNSSCSLGRVFVSSM
ncbi:hypothetical protein RND71_039789 [Anisodus tanguticus]|uniref:Uncharacterized protein n=1 Tax=Anisodus tanguticus TaxID=243964 RepID=A0AAE1UQZ2_9SOLA|nr:hypothetical protein RND71_039789 [Anisodus tanguticus]